MFSATLILTVLAQVVGVFSSPLHHLSKRRLPSTIIVPLYIYPLPGAWDPLYNVLASYQQTQFLVIINPRSGPTEDALPSQSYIDAIARLNSYSNVQTIGYVRTTWATRAIADVRSDVEKYAGWSTFNSSLTMHGIFFDEAPHTYSSDAATFVQDITQIAKSATGLGSPKMVVYNPGTIPDSRFFDASFSDSITVVYEGPYSEFTPSRRLQLAALPGDRSRYSYIVHSVPSTIDWWCLVDSLSNAAQYLFITDLTSSFFESFGGRWNAFVDNVPH